MAAPRDIRCVERVFMLGAPEGGSPHGLRDGVDEEVSGAF